MGRVWFAWWLFPLPNSNAIWLQFRSPLEWDVFAVSTYATVSILFWYMGMIPDLAVIRDRAKETWRKYFYGILSMGWRNANNHWRNFEMAYLILQAIHSSGFVGTYDRFFDFAVANFPVGTHHYFPPYFVAGAIFSGFGMVLTLLLPVRAIIWLHDLITQKHIDNICKITLATGSMVGYAYSMEFFIAWYGANPLRRFCIYQSGFRELLVVILDHGFM